MAVKPALDAPVAIADTAKTSLAVEARKQYNGHITSNKSIGRLPWVEREVVDDDNKLINIVDAMCARIRIGVSLKGACEAYGVSGAAFFNALNKGKLEQDDGLTTNHTDLLNKIARARAECRTSHVSVIASSEDWRARAWLLERQFHDEYGEKRHVEVQGLGAPQITIQLPEWAGPQLPATAEGQIANLGDKINRQLVKSILGKDGS